MFHQQKCQHLCKVPGFIMCHGMLLYLLVLVISTTRLPVYCLWLGTLTSSKDPAGSKQTKGGGRNISGKKGEEPGGFSEGRRVWIQQQRCVSSILSPFSKNLPSPFPPSVKHHPNRWHIFEETQMCHQGIASHLPWITVLLPLPIEYSVCFFGAAALMVGDKISPLTSLN